MDTHDDHEKLNPELAAAFVKKHALLNQSENVSHRRLESIFHQRATGKYVRDVVFGANDGIVTTFAVVSGVAGAALSPSIVLIMGFANLVADGISMGLGAYLGDSSEENYNRAQRKKEEWEVDNLRPIEVEEVRDIFRRYNFHGQDLDRATEIITSDRKAWVDLMMREELGILDEGDGATPAKHGLATFIAFAIAGFVPLISYVLPGISYRFELSVALSALTLFSVGASRSRFSPDPWFKGGVEMLIVGSVAGAAAFFIGKLIGAIAGV